MKRIFRKQLVFAAALTTALLFGACEQPNSPEKEEDLTYALALLKDGAALEAHAFPAAHPGYEEVEALEAELSNAGPGTARDIAISLGGEGSAAFSLSTDAIELLEPGKTAVFAVRPLAGLGEGSREATVTVTDPKGAAHSFTVSFAVSPAPVYAISLDAAGSSHTFPAAYPGYGEAEGFEATVSNVGSVLAEGIAISLSGEGSGAFTLSAGAIERLEPGKTASFTVRPATGLGEGSYQATATVADPRGTDLSFGVGFVVSSTPVHAISLDVAESHAFPFARIGYAEQDPLIVTITNIGNQGTGDLAVTLAGEQAASFQASPASVPDIAVGGTAAFALRPATGLGEGSYQATATVVCPQGADRSFAVSFIVGPAPVYAISLDAGDSHAFPSARVGYAEPEPLTVTITNTGNEATGDLAVTLAGEQAASFQASPASVPGIAVGGTAA
jgi:hypothetical protein